MIWICVRSQRSIYIFAHFISKFLTGLKAYIWYLSFLETRHFEYVRIIYYPAIHGIHPVHSRVGRTWEPSVKTLRFLFTAEFWRHCVLDETQCLRYQSYEIKLLNIFFPCEGNEATSRAYSHIRLRLALKWCSV